MANYSYPTHQSYSSPASPEPFMSPSATMGYPQQQQSFTHPHKSYSLQVTTAHQSTHDPQEFTARPSNSGSSSLPFGMEPTPTQGNAPISLSSQGVQMLDQGASTGPASDMTPSTSKSATSAPAPGLTQLTRPLNAQETENLSHLDRLKFFLATAPSLWDASAAADFSDAKNDAYSRPGTSDGYPRPGTSDGFPSSEGYPPPGASDGYPGAPDVPIHQDGFSFSATNHSSPASSISADHSSSAADHQPINACHPHHALNRFLLPSNEYVSCVLWGGLYHITGTDIVRALVFRFEAFGRPVRPAMLKKFEEGVFSDLRNLKPGVDASLEEPKSPFLDLLFKYQCIRTQKKQKVFYWFSVPHDRLFLDALERDLKREKMGLEPTTVVTGEPALSFTYDPKRSLYEQFSRSNDNEADLETSSRRSVDHHSNGGDGSGGESSGGEGETEERDVDGARRSENASGSGPQLPPALQGPGSRFFPMFSLFEGSPTYKKRKKTGGVRGLGRRLEDERRSASVDAVGDFGRSRARRERFDSLGSLSGDVNAAEAFIVQARGRRDNVVAGIGGLGAPLGTDYFGTQPYDGMGNSAPFPGISGSMLPRQRSHDEPHRHTYPMTAPAGYVPHPYQVRSSNLPLSAAGASSTQMSDMAQDGQWSKAKAFACPLFSCGRMFKRMEHLKRHLRTHTMERPYTCPRCKKRFSRSDNLNQHLRTHTRSGSYDEGGGGSGMESEPEELDTSAEAVNAGMYDDVRMCEVEVQGGIQDVPGDEEGLVAPPNAVESGVFANGSAHSQNVYYSQGMGGVQFPNDGSQYGVNPGTPDPSSSTWPTNSAFNAPSPQPNHPSIPLIRSNSARSSHNGSPASFLRQPHSSLSSSVFDANVTSLSAPSHKQQFDHAVLYPAELHMDDGSGSTGPGPVRRHRSMTPSLMRDGPESIRRPMTASSMDYVSGSGTPGARGYHPYAMSAQSSPSLYPIPLDYQDPPSSAPQLQDSIRAMLGGESRDVPPDIFAPHATSASGYGDMYRTESPAPFQGAEYGGGNATQPSGSMVTEPTMFDLSAMDAQSSPFVSPETADASAYYVPPHHVTM